LTVDDVGGYRIAIGGLSLGLVAFLIGAAGALAAGATIPAEYWTIGSAVSGALLGILAPTPETPKHRRATIAAAAAKRAELHGHAAREASDSADNTTDLSAKKALESAVKAHNSAATRSEEVAAESAGQFTAITPMVLLFLVFAFSVFFGIIEKSTVLQSLAAASGAGLVGLIVPPPSKSASKTTS
jgi:uncharacterized integral membrane protein